MPLWIKPPGARGTGRVLAGLGAVAAIWITASLFVDGVSDLEAYAAEAGHLFDGSGTSDIWELLPHTLMFFAAAAGVQLLATVCLLAGRR